jgi:hypothetical protein
MYVVDCSLVVSGTVLLLTLIVCVLRIGTVITVCLGDHDGLHGTNDDSGSNSSTLTSVSLLTPATLGYIGMSIMCILLVLLLLLL